MYNKTALYVFTYIERENVLHFSYVFIKKKYT